MGQTMTFTPSSSVGDAETEVVFFYLVFPAATHAMVQIVDKIDSRGNHPELLEIVELKGCAWRFIRRIQLVLI